MGNTACVADGATPHRMHIVIRNRSSFNLTLSNRSCQKDCDCRGFGMRDGKFIEGWQPRNIEKETRIIIAASGRAGTAVCPKGEFEYDVQGGGCLRITFDSAGWTDLLNRSYMHVNPSQEADNKLIIKVSKVSSSEEFYDNNVSATRQLAVLIDDRAGSSSSSSTLSAGDQSFNQIGSFLSRAHDALPTTAGVRTVAKAMRKDVRLLVYDGSGADVPSKMWRIGATVEGVHFDKTFGSTSTDGYRTALSEAATWCLNKSYQGRVSEIQFWCHGSEEGGVYDNGSELDTASLAILAPYTTDTACIWFRTCSTASDRGRRAPGPHSSSWADNVLTTLQATNGAVLAHAVTIAGDNGFSHTECYARTGGQWYGPISTNNTGNASAAKELLRLKQKGVFCGASSSSSSSSSSSYQET